MILLIKCFVYVWSALRLSNGIQPLVKSVNFFFLKKSKKSATLLRLQTDIPPAIKFSWFALFTAWCLRSEGVSSVLLGVSNTDQLLENLGALRVNMCCIQIYFYVLCAIKRTTQKNSRWHFKLMPPSPSFRFYLKWPLKPLLRWTPCWETSHTRRKSHALEDSNLSDGRCSEKMKKTLILGKHRFLLCCILNDLHVLGNIYASSMCAYPFCAVHYIM